jgi:hypothetical protein
MLICHYIIPAVCLVQWPYYRLIQSETWSQAQVAFRLMTNLFSSKDITVNDCTDGSLLPFLLYHNFITPPSHFYDSDMLL